MWIPSKLFLSGALTLILLQNSTPGPAAPGSSSSKSPAGATASVARSEAVITIHGACEEGKGGNAAGTSSCATVITRQQFENLEHALHPGQDLPADARNNLAKLYADYVTIDAATRKAGMKDTAEFHQFMHWMSVLAASEYYRRKLQEKYSTPSQEEIDTYYQQHSSEYESVKLVRVLVPRESASEANKDEFDKKALAIANTARASLVQGLDPVNVQKSAYAALGLQGDPNVDLGKRRRKDFIADEATAVFSLKPGEVTQVQSEPKSYVVYKVLSQDTMPEEDVKKFIASQITEKKFTDTMKSIVDSVRVDMNEQYFGPPLAPRDAPRVSPHTIVTH